MKRVFTGHDAKGSTNLSHAGSTPRQPRPGTYELWSMQGPIVIPDPTDAQSPATIGYFAKEGESEWEMVGVRGLAARSQLGPGAMAIPDKLRSHFDASDPRRIEAGFATNDARATDCGIARSQTASRDRVRGAEPCPAPESRDHPTR